MKSKPYNFKTVKDLIQLLFNHIESVANSFEWDLDCENPYSLIGDEAQFCQTYARLESLQ